MKKLLVMVMAGIIIALVGFLGVVFYLNATEPKTLTVKTEAVTVAKIFDNDSTDTDPKWLKFSFYSEDEMTAYRHCKESHDYHLSLGVMVTDIVEVDDIGGKYYYFKARNPIAE